MKYALLCALLASLPAFAAEAPPAPSVPKPGVKAVQTPFETLKPSHTFDVGGAPDWMVFTDDAVWISNRPQKKLYRIDPATNKVAAVIEFSKNPCAGLAAGFGSIWVPLCDTAAPALARVDIATNKVAALIPAGPMDGEGGIAATTDGVYLFIDRMGTMARIDPKTNEITNRIPISQGARNPIFAEGFLWISDGENNTVSVFDPAPDVHAVTTIIPAANGPRFMTAGDGFVWTLNQGDGSLTKIDARTRQVAATIQAGIPGRGGEIAVGDGAVWTTVFDIPLTQIDVKTNKVVRQWVGQGGDSVRLGFGSVWLAHLRSGLLWRFPAAAFQN